MNSTEESLGIVSRSLRVRLAVVLVALLTMTTAFFIMAVPVRGAAVASVAVPPTLPDYMRYVIVNNYKFDPLAKMPSIPAALMYSRSEISGQAYYIVQFNGPVTDSMKAGLAATGAVVLSYINYNAFIVRADSSALLRVQSLSTVRWTGVFEPAYKLSPTLSDSYAKMAQDAMEKDRSGGALGGVVTMLGSGNGPARSLTVDATGHPTPASASNLAPSASTDAAPSAGGSSLGSALGGLSPSPDTARAIATYTSSRITVTVLTFEKSWVPAATQAIAALGGTNIVFNFNYAGWGTIQAKIDKNLIPTLARVPGIMWIDRNFQPYVFNDIARWVIQSGNATTFATPVHNHGIYGTNQTVTLGDTGIDYKHPDFWDPNNTTPGPTARKLTAYYEGCGTGGGCDLTDNGWNHGTHTSGSVAGDDGKWHIYDGNPTGSNGTTGPHDGQAFDAFLNVQDLSNDGYYVYYTNIDDLWNLAVNHSSWIHSDSWGSCCSTYEADSATTDAFVWNNVNFTIVFAAANAGPYLYSMNPLGGSKNVVAVGASANGAGDENVADFSSRGPMNDGRLKPDVMAPGVGLWSAAGACPSPCGGTTYKQGSGTSMATPTVAGGATLIRQYYMDGWYPTGTMTPADGFTPTAALIKATLINSAVEMTGSGAYANGQNYYPNDNQGWGRILLDNALYFQGDARGTVIDDHRAGMSTGDYANYSLAIGDTSQPVKITLVWSDYPGVPYTSPNLVNDLDLVVTAPDGTVYRGNVFAGMNPGQSVPNPDVNLTDHLNNVENVLVISNVQAGAWSISVHAFNVPQGPQPFALVMTGGIATNRGQITLDKGHYQSSALVHVRVVDTGPNVNPHAPDTLTVNMTSTTETTPEVITLNETGNDTSVFEGSIRLQNNATPVPGDGILQVQNGDTITADYFDLNNGQNQSVHVIATAIVDDTPPVISNVAVTGLRFNRATITWTTDEPSDSVVYWDTVTPPGNVASDLALVTSHSIALKNLAANTTYFFAVQSTDEAGNTALDNNGSAYYRFTTPLMPPTAPPDEEWPTFHNNQPRLGVSPRAFSPPLTQEWTAGPYTNQFWNGPVFADGILFTYPLDGTLRARDPYTGKILWSRTLGGQYYYTGTPTVANGVVYAAYDTGSASGVVALNENTGNTIWSVSGGSPYYNAREAWAAADGMLFGTLWDGHIIALDQSNGSLVWAYQTGESYLLVGPTVSGGLVFAGTTANDMFAVDEFTGNLVWMTTLDGPITSVALYAAGVVYVGTNGGTMYALDAFSGNVIWSNSAFGLIDFSTPSYDGTNLYFGSYGNDAFYGVDATTGAVLWTTPTNAPVGTTVAYANGFVYGNCWDGIFRVMNATNGNVVDQYTLNSWASTSAPAISDGWVWFEDYYGNAYGYFGQLPVGFTLRPISQSKDAVPNSEVNYSINVTNVGISGPDTFDVNVSLGSHAWAVSLFQADGTTPLNDTNGDGTPDTGPLATGASATIIARVTVPPTVNPGDTEVSRLIINSVKDNTFVKKAKLTTTVPPPGVSISPRPYFTPSPGTTVVATLHVQNTGGFPDTIDITNSSSNGWNVRLYEADGVTPLPDTNGNGIPDTGVLAGLTSATIVVQVDVPARTPLDTLERTTITGTSSLDPTVHGSTMVVIELVRPPSGDWPTFHNDNYRHGQSPSVMAPPLRWLWSTGTNTMAEWSGPVEDQGILFSATMDGAIRAYDPYSGTVLWSRKLGGQNYYTGVPTVANGIVYTIMDTGSVSGVYALDEYTGSTIWSLTGGSPFYNARIALAYRDGMVFGSDWSGDIFALNATDGTQVWSYFTGTSMLPFGGMTVSGGKVFMPVIDQNTFSGYLFALDEMNGTLAWRVGLDNVATSIPLYAQGNVFEGTYSGTMYALDASTGAVVWQATGFSMIDFSTPAYDGTGIYFGTFANTYVGLDAGTGAVLWQTAIGGSVGSSMAYANGYLYGTAWDGYLRVLWASNGTIAQAIKLDTWASTSSPAISRGWVWLEDLYGEVYGFGAPGAGEVRAIQVLPGTADIQVGKAALFKATGVDAFGNRIPVKDADWLPLQGLGSVLKVSGDTALYIAGILAGNDTLQATSEGFAGNATVHVLPGTLDRIQVYMRDPQGNRIDGPVSIEAGAQRTFGAEATDRFGNPITGATFTWTAAGSIGTIDSAGVFHASTTVGTGYVTATYGGRTGQQLVTIVPGAPAAVDIGLTSTSLEVDSYTLIVGTVRDQYGNAISDGIVSWTTTGGSVLSLTPDGRSILYHASTTTTPASAQLTATIGNVTQTITLTIVAGPTELIQVAMLVGGSPSSDPVSIPAGSHQTFVAAATDRFGNPIVGATFVWGATGGIGTIDSAGRFTASTTPGTGFVSATQGGRTGRQTVTVVPAAPATLAIETPSTSLMVDSQSLVVASVLDVYGNPNLDGVVRWTTSGTGTVLSLTPDGRSILYHAPITTTPASVQLTATIGTVAQTISLTIVAGPAVGISIDAPATTVAVGGTLAFGAVVTDQFGNAVTGATIAWKTTAGSINQQGVFTAPSQPGTVVITASTAGRESFVVIDVTSGGFEQFTREATSATSLALLVATVIAIAACVFLFVRYRGTRRELDEMRKGGQTGGGGGVT